MNPSSILAEAQRRKVIRTAGIYAVGAAGVWGAAEVLVDALGLPPVVLTFVVVTSLVGFPFALLLSWYYRLGPEESAASEGDGRGGGDTGPQASTGLLPATPSMSRAVAVGLSAAVVGFIGLAASVAMKDDSAPAATGSATPYTRTQITFTGSAADPVFSPDGRFLAFRATLGDPATDPYADTLMVMELGAAPRALAPLVTTRFPYQRVFWSGDGSEIWFQDGDSTVVTGWPFNLYGIPREGGARRLIWKTFTVGISDASGHNLILPHLEDSLPGVQIHDLTTGSQRNITFAEPGFVPVTFTLSAATGLLAVGLVDMERSAQAVWVLSLGDDPDPTGLDVWDGDVDQGHLPRTSWGDDGAAVYYDRNGRLWRRAVDPATGASVGEGTFTGHDLTGGFSVSPDGHRLALEQRLGGNNLWIFPLDGDTLRPPGRRLTRGTFNRGGLLSPDGTRVAMVTREGDTRRVTVMDVESGAEHPLTSTPVYGETDIAWSPDGSRLAFVAPYDDGYRVYTVSAQGTDQRVFEEPLVDRSGGITWCGSGAIVVPTKGGSALATLDPETGEARPVPLDVEAEAVAPLQIFRPVCSPSGTEVAFMLFNAAGRGAGLHAADLGSGSVREIFAHPRATPGRWSGDGWIYAGDTRIPESGGVWQAFEVAPGVPALQMMGQVTPGGTHMLVSVPESVTSDLYLIEYQR